MTDLRFAFRQMARDPVFTLVAAVTLALGIGANTAIFSVINALLMRPLPYPHPEQLVTLWERSTERGVEQERVSGPNYLDWREQNSVFTELAASPGWQGSEEFNLVLVDSIAKIRATYTSASLFTTLGTPPLLGRTLLPEEDAREGNRAAVLSFGLWQRHFGGDSNVIGKTLILDTYGRREYTVVGVMPSGFGLPSRAELWLPMGWMGVSLTERRSAHWHHVIGRLKQGVTLARARTEMNAIQARLKQAYPNQAIGTEVAIVPVLDQAVGRNLKTALFVLWGVVIGILAIACANVANLLLARTASRGREIALRAALGAGRWRVIRQLLIESLLLGILGGGLGILFGAWGIRWFVTLSPGNIPRLNEVTLDSSALFFTLIVSLITGVIFGVGPAWQFSRPNLSETLKEGSRGASAGIAARRMRQLLIVGEVALSLVMLAWAGLMLQSFMQVLKAERGFNPEHLVTAELDFSVSGFSTWVRPTATRPQVPLRQLMERLRAVPGVEAVGAGSRLLRRDNQPASNAISVFGRPAEVPEKQLRAEFKGISPGWLQALGGRVLRGRDFTEADILEAPGVMVINETLARRYFPNENPIGQYFKMGTEQPALSATNVWGFSDWSTIIGVVSDTRSLTAQPDVVPEAYASYWQWPMQSPTLLVRTRLEPGQIAEIIRRETKNVIPNIPPPVIRTMNELLSESVAQPRLQARLLALFAGLALLLASVGLYGVLAYTVTQRRREIGVRIALGAQKRDVLALIMGQGFKLAMTGVIIGLGAALVLTRVLQSLLYEVKPTDPTVLAGVSGLLLVVTLLACWIPAQRAARIDPSNTLRAD